MHGRNAPNQRTELLISLALALTTLAVFGHVCANDFVNIDDDAYVTHNPNVLGGLTWNNIRWAFTAVHSSNWHPLTWLSLQLDAQLFKKGPWGFHLTNLLLHAANVVLLFVALRVMTGAVWRSAIVAALFASHPLHVESVAWVAERKDVLSGFFWMATLLAYAWYVRRPHWGRYLLVALALALGLLAKPMLVTLPCVLLLLDYWPLRRWQVKAGDKAQPAVPARVLLLEKLPLFALAAASCAMTVVAQRDALSSLEKLPFDLRLGNALVAYVRYLMLTFDPLYLAVYYPHPRQALPLWEVLGALSVLLVISYLTLWRERQRPFLAVGWLWYLGTLVPVIGLVQVGTQSHADRYTYIPLIGIFLMLTWAGGEVVERGYLDRRSAAAVLSILLGTCLILTWVQVHYWRDSLTLWEHNTQVTPHNALAQSNLGTTLLALDRPDEALPHLEEAVHQDPDYQAGQANLGIVLVKLGRPQEAIPHLQIAVRLNPVNAAAQLNLGIALAEMRKLSEALPYLQEAMRLEPDNAGTPLSLGMALAELQLWNEAAPYLEEALRQNPRALDAHFFLAQVCLARDDLANANYHVTLVLQQRPTWPQALSLRKTIREKQSERDRRKQNKP